MTDPTTIVHDGNGKTLAVGYPVRIFGCDIDRDKPEECYGIVTAITDPDGDVNDYGRVVSINPTVAVLFDDGSDDSFTTFMPINGWTDYMREDIPWRCDDLELL